MKKILIALRDFNTGGVQKSLINFINELRPELDKNLLAIDILVIKKGGILQSELPSNVRVLEANPRFLPFGVSNAEAKRIGKKFFIKRSVLALFAKIFGNKPLVKRALKKEPERTGYDVAISYAVSISDRLLYAGWTEILLNNVQAKEKWVYIHNDFVNSGLNNNYVHSLLNKFDKLLFVSRSCEQDYLKNFPSYEGKTETLHNFIDCNNVLDLAKESANLFDCGTGLKIISVSRLSPEKAHIRTLDVLGRLKQEGYRFSWHILGDGPTREEIVEKIKQLGLSDCVVLYGNQPNPHKFTKHADLFLLGSFNESFGLVIIDSMLLGVPVLSTKTISAEEVVGDYGFVCENSEDGLYIKLKEILDSGEILKRKRSLLTNYSYKNGKIKDQLLRLLGIKEIK